MPHLLFYDDFVMRGLFHGAARMGGAESGYGQKKSRAASLEAARKPSHEFAYITDS